MPESATVATFQIKDDQMLLSTKAVIGCSLENGERNVGAVDDLFFNDESWVVRYLVVSTDGWLGGRRVLLPPTAVEQRPIGGCGSH